MKCPQCGQDRNAMLLEMTTDTTWIYCFLCGKMLKQAVYWQPSKRGMWIFGTLSVLVWSILLIMIARAC